MKYKPVSPQQAPGLFFRVMIDSCVSFLLVIFPQIEETSISTRSRRNVQMKLDAGLQAKHLIRFA
jgi:hypothetical protein